MQRKTIDIAIGTKWKSIAHLNNKIEFIANNNHI